MRINSSSHIHALAYLCVFENSIYISDDGDALLLLFRARRETLSNQRNARKKPTTSRGKSQKQSEERSGAFCDQISHKRERDDESSKP